MNPSGCLVLAVFELFPSGCREGTITDSYYIINYPVIFVTRPIYLTFK